MRKGMIAWLLALVLLAGLAVPVAAEGMDENPVFPFQDIGELGNTKYHVVMNIWEQEGQPKHTKAIGIEDVSETSPFYEAVYWFVEQKIHNLISDEWSGTAMFLGDEPMMRLDVAVLLYDYANYLGIDTSTSEEDWPFKEELDSRWYYDQVHWCYENGLLADMDGELWLYEDNQCAHAHVQEERTDREPSCFADGCVSGLICMDCDGVVEAEKVIASTGHDWDNGYIGQYPQFYSGYRVHTCRNCQQTTRTVIPRNNPLSHVRFADVGRDVYYKEPVYWAVQFGITTGVDESHFAPHAGCTRGQVVTFLWRACGSPEPAAGDNPFVDVSANDYYYEAVLWAVQKGITKGIDSTHFSPNGLVTRGQVVTFLWRYAGCPEVTTDDNVFTDVVPEQYYAMAVNWAVEEGVTTGMTETTFAPNETCTRAQVVTFLYRSC